MRAPLAIIAVSGFVVAAVSLGGALALGGNTVGKTGFGLGWPSCDSTGMPAATATIRSLPWDGGSERATIAVAANVHYQNGVGDQLVIKGDPRIVSHIRVHDGIVDRDCRFGFFHFGGSDRVDVTLPGRKTFQEFEMLGSGNMQLSGLSQPALKIVVSGSGNVAVEGITDRLETEVNGSGNVDARGKTDDLKAGIEGSGTLKLDTLVAKNADIDISGSGGAQLANLSPQTVKISVSGSGDVEASGTTDNLDVEASGAGELKLGRLAAKNIDVDISGSGNAEIAPQDSLNVTISGSGTIYLRSEPKKLEASIQGSGHIVHPDGQKQDRHDRHARLERNDIFTATANSMPTRRD